MRNSQKANRLTLHTKYVAALILQTLHLLPLKYVSLCLFLLMPECNVDENECLCY